MTGDGPTREQVDAFAAELADLRAAAGNPSFRRMAERSGCISHTTLHEAVTGARFPSWETTREFVKACGADEQPWRTRWEVLKDVPVPEVIAERRPRWLFALVGVGVALLVITAVVVVRTGGAAVDTGARIPGDASTFIADVTVPDGMEVHVDQTVVKVWDVQNTGSVPWHDRFLQRMDLPAAPDSCGTPDRVPVGDTAPGEHTMISVAVRTPSKPGRCWIGWKMVDAAGTQFFASRRPLYLLVTVVP
jgi:hypothetical protein